MEALVKIWEVWDLLVYARPDALIKIVANVNKYFKIYILSEFI